MKTLSAEFIKSAVDPKQYPQADFPEVAFVGRSNVGKSSLINALTGKKGLAKTSNTPGRTQLINFFFIDRRYIFVDLPGYGFARVPEAVRKGWGPMVETYLRERANLRLVVLIMDIRREPSGYDLELMRWLSHYCKPYLTVLTKTDKLSRSQVLLQSRRFASLLTQGTGRQSHHGAVLFSAKTKEGKDAIWSFIEAL